MVAIINWRRLLLQAVALAWSLAMANAGKSKLARMAIMAITTSNSIKVKPPRLFEHGEGWVALVLGSFRPLRLRLRFSASCMLAPRTTCPRLKQIGGLS